MTTHGSGDQPEAITTLESAASSGSSNSARISELYPLIDETSNTDVKDSSPWTSKNVLSLDGGGIRGYSSLILLEALMKRIADLELSTQWIDETLRKEYGLDERDVRPAERDWASRDYPWKGPLEIADPTFYPAHYFDYIAGTSTGGLSAIMLGRLRMSVAFAKSQYQTFGNDVFGKPRRAHMKSPVWVPRPKYTATQKRNAILNVIRRAMAFHHLNTSAYTIQTEKFAAPAHGSKGCHSMVVSLAVKKIGKRRTKRSRGYVHRTYDQPISFYNEGIASVDPICDVAIATSAAPILFEAHVIGDLTHHDGGIGFNNPAQVAFTELECKHKRGPRLLLSIGTGVKPDDPDQLDADDFEVPRRTDSSRWQRLKRTVNVIRYASDMLTNKDNVHDMLQSKANIDRNFEYTRLDVPSDIQEDGSCLGELVFLDEWRPKESGRDTLERIERMTTQYLNRPQTRDDIEEIAKILVLRRRQRARTDRWERYAMDVRYRCCLSDECHFDTEPKSRPTMRRHLEQNHSEHVRGRQKLEEKLNDCRENPQTRAEARMPARRRMSTARTGTGMANRSTN